MTLEQAHKLAAETSKLDKLIWVMKYSDTNYGIDYPGISSAKDRNKMMPKAIATYYGGIQES